MENTTLNFGGGKRQRGGDWAGFFNSQDELDLWTQLNTNELFVGLRATLPSGPVIWRGAGLGWVGVDLVPVPAGNLWAFCGDSIVNGSSATNFRFSLVPKTLAAFSSLFMRQDSLECGVSGARSAYIANTVVPAAIAAGAKRFVIAVGMNDSAVSIPVSEYMANIVKCVNLIAGIGGTLVLVCPTPRGSSSTAAQVASLRAYRKALKVNQGLYGYFLADGYEALIDTATGYLAAAYDSGDGVHPNNLGHQKLFMAIAQEIYRVRDQIWSGRKPIVLAGDADSMVSNGTFASSTSGWFEQPGGTGATATQALVADTSGILSAGQWVQRDVDGTSSASNRTFATVIYGTFAAGDIAMITAKIQVDDVSGTWESAVVAGTAGCGMQILNSSAIPLYQRLQRDTGIKNKATGFYDIDVCCFVSGFGAQTNLLLWFAQTVPVGSRFKFRLGEVGVYNATALGIAPTGLRGNEATNFL